MCVRELAACSSSYSSRPGAGESRHTFDVKKVRDTQTTYRFREKFSGRVRERSIFILPPHDERWMQDGGKEDVKNLSVLVSQSNLLVSSAPGRAWSVASPCLFK